MLKSHAVVLCTSSCVVFTYGYLKIIICAICADKIVHQIRESNIDRPLYGKVHVYFSMWKSAISACWYWKDYIRRPQYKYLWYFSGWQIIVTKYINLVGLVRITCISALILLKYIKLKYFLSGYFVTSTRFISCAYYWNVMLLHISMCNNSI